MKRDMELIRTILLVIEEHDPMALGECEEFKEVRNEVLAGHVRLLKEMNYIDRGLQDRVYRLKPAGHEFIANAKDATVWKKVTDEIKEKAPSVSIGVLTQLLAKATAKSLGL